MIQQEIDILDTNVHPPLFPPSSDYLQFYDNLT